MTLECLRRLGRALTATVCCAVVTAELPSLPPYPGLDKSTGINAENPLALCWARTADASLRRLVRDSLEGNLKPRRITAVLWHNTFAQQLRSHTLTGSWYSKVRPHEGRLMIAGGLGSVNEGRNTVTTRIPMHIAIKLNKEIEQHILSADRNRTLSIVIECDAAPQELESLREELRILPLQFANCRTTFRDLDKVIFSGKPEHVGHKPDVVVIDNPEDDEPDEVLTESVVTYEPQEFEAEDFDGIRVFGDWELNQKSWYGRMIRGWMEESPYSGSMVAVAHPVATGHPLTKTLPAPLEPGRYEILLDCSYHRTRLDDNLVEVSLGDTSHRFSWFVPPNFYAEPEKEGFVRGPIFDLKKPAKSIRITPLQFGGGALSEIPALQERFIIIDRVLVQRLGE